MNLPVGIEDFPRKRPGSVWILRKKLIEGFTVESISQLQS